MSKFKIFIIKSFGSYNLFFNKCLFKFSNINIISFRICGRVVIKNRGRIIIGENFKGNSGKNCNPIGGDVILRLITGSEGELKIGNNVGISNSTIYANKAITIEDGVLIGGGCKIWDTNFHSLCSDLRGTKMDTSNAISSPILIKRKAFIGASTIILKGVTIGTNSIIAAGSVISKSVPDNEVWGGNPAKFIKKIESINK